MCGNIFLLSQIFLTPAVVSDCSESCETCVKAKVLIHEVNRTKNKSCHIAKVKKFYYKKSICSSTFISDKINFNENLAHFISNPKIGLLNKLNIFLILHKNIFGGKHTIKILKNIG